MQCGCKSKWTHNKQKPKRRLKVVFGEEMSLLQGSSASTVTRGAGNMGLYYGKSWELAIPEIKAYILMPEFLRLSNEPIWH